MSTPSLEQIQIDFLTYVLNETSENASITSQISTLHGVDAHSRLKIYYEAYRFRLRDALASAYDKTYSYLGDALFEQMSLGYIKSHTSQHRNLRWYGDQFSAFLVESLPEHPIVAELAAFEWDLSLAFDAPDTPVLKLEDLGKISEEEWEIIGFHVHPSVQFLSMNWNTSDIWHALDKDEVPPCATASTESVTWIIWRKDLQSHFRSIDQYELQALKDLQQGQSFSSIREAISEDAGDEDIALRIGGWLQLWIGDEILCD